MRSAYMQPLAQHRNHPERLLLRGADGRVYVWFGDNPDAAPAEIDRAVARWFLQRPDLIRLPTPGIWLHATDLPLAAPARALTHDGRR